MPQVRKLLHRATGHSTVVDSTRPRSARGDLSFVVASEAIRPMLAWRSTEKETKDSSRSTSAASPRSDWPDSDSRCVLHQEWLVRWTGERISHPVSSLPEAWFCSCACIWFQRSFTPMEVSDLVTNRHCFQTCCRETQVSYGGLQVNLTQFALSKKAQSTSA